MPLENTILKLDTIHMLCKTHYGISVSQIVRLDHGSANCYCLLADDKKFFLKEYQSGFTEGDLCRETKLVAYLTEHDFPTAAIIPTIDCQQFLEYKGRYIALQSWVEGKTYIHESLPNDLLMESAEWLGKLHTILREYDLPRDMDARWVSAFSPKDAEEQYNELLAVLNKQTDVLHCENIKRDLLFKKELVYKVADFKSCFDGITYCATHGDYSSFQYICKERHIQAIIDFSSAKTLPVVWEIIRSYVLSTFSCKDGAPFDLNEFCEYVAAYLKYASLNEKDMTAMPYVYLFQLARSKYGYREYLVAKTENKTDLLQFALWRTEICREMLDKKEAIAKRLRQLL